VRQGGFSLLEAMVAIVILAAASMAFYGLFNTNLITLTRVQEVSREVPLVEQAIEYLTMMNLSGDSAGEFEIDTAQIQWQAELIESYRQSQNGRGFMGYFQVGLYNVEFTVTDRDSVLGTYRFRAVGYEKVREPGG
jgi:general secretion pathway protein I